MGPDLTKPERTHAPPTYRACRACGDVLPIDEMRPVGNGPADLGTILGGRWMCADETPCLKRHAARSKGDPVMHIVIIPTRPGAWGGGHAPLYTDNPRDAEDHAAAYHAVVVRQHIHTDYREIR